MHLHSKHDRFPPVPSVRSPAAHHPHFLSPNNLVRVIACDAAQNFAHKSESLPSLSSRSVSLLVSLSVSLSVSHSDSSVSAT